MPWFSTKPKPERARSAERRVGSWPRRFACSMLALAVLVLPDRAHAQFGALLVYDPAAVGKLITQLSQQAQQIALARDHLKAQLDNMRKLGNPSWRTITSTVSQIDALTREGQAISYSLASLDTEFRRTFPGSISGGRLAPTLAGSLREQDQRTLATLRGLLNAAQATSQQFATGTARLTAMKAQIGSIQSAQQAAELNGVIGIHTAEEITLLRQQLVAQSSTQAVLQANRVNRDLQGAAVARDLWQPGAAVPVRRKDMRVESVGFIP
jgi:P-type conjugative transfer protein TrbJ